MIIFHWIKSRDDEGLIELKLRFFFFNVTGISGNDGRKRLTVLLCKKQIENQTKLSKTST